jgi:hypothetical protein
MRESLNPNPKIHDIRPSQPNFYKSKYEISTSYAQIIRELLHLIQQGGKTLIPNHIWAIPYHNEQVE